MRGPIGQPFRYTFRHLQIVTGDTVMQCCPRYCTAEAKFNSKVAERDLRRYRRRGATTKLLLAELHCSPLQGASILDIGSGIGVIGMELANSGGQSATFVEASPAYFEVARSEVESRHGSASDEVRRR